MLISKQSLDDIYIQLLRIAGQSVPTSYGETSGNRMYTQLRLASGAAEPTGQLHITDAIYRKLVEISGTAATTYVGQTSIDLIAQKLYEMSGVVGSGSALDIIYQRLAVMSPAANNFLARTSGLDASHTNAYKALINGLVADGVWAKLDALYMFATDTSTNALLNLVSATYNATATGAPTFTANSGYLGAAGKYVDTNFNPTTAVAPKYIRNDASIFAWSNTAAQKTGALMGQVGGAGNAEAIYSRFTDDKTYYIVNATVYSTATNTDGSGFYHATRTGASATVGYKNGVAAVTDTTASAAPSNVNIAFLTDQASAFTGTVMAGGIGSGMTAAQALLLYNRVHTYLQTIAGIA